MKLPLPAAPSIPAMVTDLFTRVHATEPTPYVQPPEPTPTDPILPTDTTKLINQMSTTDPTKPNEQTEPTSTTESPPPARASPTFLPIKPSRSNGSIPVNDDSFQLLDEFDEPFVCTSADVSQDKLSLQATLYGIRPCDETTVIRADVPRCEQDVGEIQPLRVVFSGTGSNRQFQRQTACSMLAAMIADPHLRPANLSLRQKCQILLRPHANLDLEIKEYAQLGFVQTDENNQCVRLSANIGEVLVNSGWARSDSATKPPSLTYSIKLSMGDQEALQCWGDEHVNTPKRARNCQEQQTTIEPKRRCESPVL